MVEPDLGVGTYEPRTGNKCSSPTSRSHGAQDFAMSNSQEQASDSHELVSDGEQADPEKSDDTVQGKIQITKLSAPKMAFTDDTWHQQDITYNVPEMATKDIWNEKDPRQQDPLAPRSAYPWRPGYPPSQDIYVAPEDLDRSDFNTNGPHGKGQPKIPQTQQGDPGQASTNHAVPTSTRRASGNQVHSPPRAYSPAMPKTNYILNSRDLEDGTQPTHGLDRDKDKYDIDGRKRIILPRRTGREQPYTPPKSNYGPGAIPPPEPTYLDRHGRTELQVFQALVGVHFLDNAGAPIPIEQKQQQPASVMSDIFVPSRAAAYRHRNRGLYDRCISMDMKMRVMYSFSHYMITFLYLLQILVAATLTAISAYTDTASIAITTLGAINTVLAGILAWLNGQGMPIRYRRARDQFREVVKAIEASERLFAIIDYMDWSEGTRPTPLGERDRLEELYNQARHDMEANYPDTHQGPDMNAQANEAKKMEAKVEKHKQQKIATAAELKALQEEKQQLETKLASKVASDAEKQSKDDSYAQELQEREESVRKMHEQVTQVKHSLNKQYKDMQQVIVDMCAEKGLSSDDVFKREAMSRNK